MKNILSILLISLLSNGLAAQVRYLENTFDSTEVSTLTYAKKDGENLDMDVYQPAFDSNTSRPVIIYVHGGGFSGGTRNSGDIKKFCKNLSQLGYVTVSISYRLSRKDKPEAFGCDCPVTDKLNTFISAVQDLHDATFKLIQLREHYRIDPQKIILAGSSAGAETVLNAAYEPPYCYGLESGPVSYAGVISMAGAIPDTNRIFTESAVPSMFFHGTCDELVPYATAPHHHCQKGKPGYLILHGSYTIAQKLAKLNVPYWLHTTCGAGHEMASLPMKLYFNDIKEFCYHFVINRDSGIRNTVVPGNQAACDYEQFSFCRK